MIEASRDVRTNQEFAEVRDSKHSSECADSLFENLLPMGYKQKAWLPLVVFIETLKVECCDDGLARPGRRNNQIAPISMNNSLRFESVENSFLKRVWPNRRRWACLMIRIRGYSTAVKSRARAKSRSWRGGLSESALHFHESGVKRSVGTFAGEGFTKSCRGWSDEVR